MKRALYCAAVAFGVTFCIVAFLIMLFAFRIGCAELIGHEEGVFIPPVLILFGLCFAVAWKDGK